MKLTSTNSSIGLIYALKKILRANNSKIKNYNKKIKELISAEIVLRMEKQYTLITKKLDKKLINGVNSRNSIN